MCKFVEVVAREVSSSSPGGKRSSWFRCSGDVNRAPSMLVEWCLFQMDECELLAWWWTEVARVGSLALTNLQIWFVRDGTICNCSRFMLVVVDGREQWFLEVNDSGVLV